MPTKKSSAPPKKTQKKPKVVTGSGAKKKQPSFWANTPRTILLAIFALSFGAVGFYLLKSSLADTGTTITVASWNSKIDNKKNIAGQTKTLLKTADVVGLQEVHTAAQRNNIRNLIESDKYAVSPKAHTNNDSGSGVESYPIVWREKEFVRTAEGTTGQVSPSLDGLRPRYITWVKLKQRATGKQFYVVNTHMVRDVDSNGSLSSKKANVKAYTGHMEKLGNLVKKLQKDNVPIFVTGDFAMDYRKDTGKVGVFPKAALGAIGGLEPEDISDIIAAEVAGTIAYCQTVPVDPFGFSEIAARAFLTRGEWKRYNWLERFQEASVNVNVNIISLGT